MMSALLQPAFAVLLIALVWSSSRKAYADGRGFVLAHCWLRDRRRTIVDFAFFHMCIAVAVVACSLSGIPDRDTVPASLAN